MTIRAALKRILEEPYGCPMCRSGQIITAGKKHWDTCGYWMAEEALRSSDEIWMRNLELAAVDYDVALRAKESETKLKPLRQKILTLVADLVTPLANDNRGETPQQEEGGGS